MKKSKYAKVAILIPFANTGGRLFDTLFKYADGALPFIR
jgi:hypothetical protein